MLKKIELLANVSIIIAALLLVTVLIKRNLPQSPQSAAAASPPAFRIQPGTKIQLPDVDWGRNGQTLLLALSEGCRFCSESAGFYQRLAGEKGMPDNPRLVAVLPQEVSRGQAYLNNLGVAVDDVKQSTLGAIGVSGTPTLILVDSAGIVQESWVGKLPPEREAEVLRRLHSARAAR
ncbi:MAG TPA: hypothetical protein VGB61_14830 [Pyrinomonadaceae bacterium]|jgi:hypothetical protein